MAHEIRLDLAQDRVVLAPGDTTTVALTLRNTSDVVEHLAVEVRGLPVGSESRPQPALVKLLPRAQADCQVSVTLAGTPPAPAGPHVLGFLARSPHNPQASRCAELVLEVPEQPAVALAVRPEVVRAGARARYLVHVDNEGNTPLALGLAGTDPELLVTFAFQPQRVDLRPGRGADVAVTASAPRAWTGQELRRVLSLSCTAGAVGASTTATFVQTPRLAPGVLRPVAALTGLLVVAGMVLGGVALAKRDTAAPVQQTTGTSPTPSGPSTAPPTTATATPTADPTPATAPPTPSATSPTTAPATPTTDPPPPTLKATPVPVHFDDGLSGPPRVVDSPWEVAGVQIEPLPGLGRSSDGCEDVDHLAVHESGARAFVTAADPQDPDRCADVGLEITFTQPLAPDSEVNVALVDPGRYTISLNGRAPEPQDVQQGSILKVPVGPSLETLSIAGERAGAPPIRVGLLELSYMERQSPS